MALLSSPTQSRHMNRIAVRGLVFPAQTRCRSVLLPRFHVLSLSTCAGVIEWPFGARKSLPGALLGKISGFIVTACRIRRRVAGSSAVGRPLGALNTFGLLPDPGH